MNPSDNVESDSGSSSSDPLDTRNDEGWEDVENDEISETIVSLFDDRTFPNATEMFQYCKSNHNFDMWQLQKQYDLDFLGLVKLVNYIRKQVKSGNTKPDISSKSLFEDEMFLMPVIEDDALLYNLEDVIQAGKDNAPDEVEELREELERLKFQFAAYRQDVQKQLDIKLADDAQNLSNVGTSSSRAKEPGAENDADYFKSYSYNSIHESMLKDKIRTDSYRDFIYDNKHLFKDKVVLDVGCGTGILSMFCAKAGAKMVIAVDNSDIIQKAQQIVFENGLQDKVRCLRGKIEEVSLPVDKVDIIVSEWMGYCLLFESMLDSVIYARDKYLIPGGLMVPSHASIHLAPLADSELRISYIDFWKDVYGFDMNSMLERAHEEALVRILDDKEIAAESYPVLTLDLHRAKVEDLDFKGSFELKAKDGFDVLEGFVIWFDMIFMPSSEVVTDSKSLTVEAAKKNGMVAFSTGPAYEPTHWQQAICLIKEPIDKLEEGKKVAGHVKYQKKVGRERSLDITIEWVMDSGKPKSQTWFID